MAIYTKEQFRQAANLTWNTWEGPMIKTIQKYLDDYGKGIAGSLPNLEKAVDDWLKKPEHLSTDDNSRRKSKLSAITELSAQLKNEKLHHAAAAKGLAIISRNVNKINVPFQQEMDGHLYDLNLKCEFRQSDFSIAPEMTISFPIMVYGGNDSLKLWKKKGYAEDTFKKNVHGDEELVEGAGVTNDLKKNWSDLINHCWGGVQLRNDNGKTFSLKFEFRFVEDPKEACAEVCCVRTKNGTPAKISNPTGTIDAVRWGVDDRYDPHNYIPGPICHEVGHFLGNPDEYNHIKYLGYDKNFSAGYSTKPDGSPYGIMNNPNGMPRVRNYVIIAKKIAEQLKWDLTKSYVLLHPALGPDNPAQKKAKLSDGIWGGANLNDL